MHIQKILLLAFDITTPRVHRVDARSLRANECFGQGGTILNPERLACQNNLSADLLGGSQIGSYNKEVYAEAHTPIVIVIQFSLDLPRGLPEGLRASVPGSL